MPDVRLTWQGGSANHSSVLASCLSQSQVGVSGDLEIVCGDMRLSVHQAVVAASSPFLASLLDGETAVLCLVDVTPWEAKHLVQFIYNGSMTGLTRWEAGQVLEAGIHLGISGLRLGAGVELLPCSTNMEDDEVFTEDREDEVAVDLSPVSRHPPLHIDNPLLSSSKRLLAMNKISQALHRTSGSISSSSLSSGSPVDFKSNSTSSRESRSSSYDHPRDSRGSGSQETILNRIKKPKPLTNLPTLESSSTSSGMMYLKPRTPRTPLIASPDCQVLEERFRHLIEGTNPTEQEKLRNLSVSSADFNFDPGNGSQPGTPFRSRSFHFPPFVSSTTAENDQRHTSLDLSIKKISDSPPPPSIPTITVIKPEPEDSNESYHLSRSTSSPHTINNQYCPEIKQETNDSNHQPSNTRVEGGGYLFPSGGTNQFPNSLQQLGFSYLTPTSSTSPTPKVLQTGQDPVYRLMVPSKNKPKQESKTPLSASSSTPSSLNNKKQPKQEPNSINKQSFKCQKCGKCYNWNYNLNRHMRFECGIENRFECSMCQKRFPYKQNAAIHLKRKHKLAIDNADEMLALGHITLLPVDKQDDIKEDLGIS